MRTRAGTFGIVAVLGLMVTAIASAQDLQLHVTYVCSGERMFIENCNIRDLSDTANCFVGHPDTILSNGLMKYTNETRGSLKKLLPTCKQPSADEVARTKAFDKKVADKQETLRKEAEAKMNAPPAPGGAGGEGSGGVVKPQTAEQKALNRCIAAGRVPATCMGNTLSKPFDAIVASVLPSVGKTLPPGMQVTGAFEGKGGWRIEFDDRFAMVTCSGLHPAQQNYTLELKNNRAVLTVENSPKPFQLMVRPDGLLEGPGSVVVNGTLDTGSHYETNYSGGQTLVVEYVHVTRNCAQPVLSSKGAAPSATEWAGGVLKSMFNDGDAGPPTPAGLRMHGNYAAQTGLSVEFYPESVIVACGEPAKAYPYEVVANGAQTAVKVADAGHPLLLNMRADGTLDPGAGTYLVHGRRITGQNGDGDFTFAPLEVNCNLGVLVPGAAERAPAAAPVMTTASTVASNAPATGAGGAVRPTAMPAGAVVPGNAVLSFSSGMAAAQAGGANPLAGRAFVLLRGSFDNVLAKGGFPVPTGVAPYKAMLMACAQRTPDCQTASNAINAATAAGVRADGTGKATLPGVAPGTYYLMGSTFAGGQILLWDVKVELRGGTNSIALNQGNATPVK
jgi:hypothetical protein